MHTLRTLATGAVLVATLGALAVAGEARAQQPLVQADSSPSESALGLGGQRRLTDDLGRSYPVHVSQHTRLVGLHDGKAQFATTTLLGAFPLPSMRAASFVQSSTLGGCENDGSYSVLMCLTQFYDLRNDDGIPYASVDKYVASWTRNDLQFALLKGTIFAGVNGPCSRDTEPAEGCGNDRQLMTVNSPSSGAAYTLYPRWAGRFVRVEAFAHFQCAYSTVTVRRGSRTWTMTHSHVCQGSTEWD
ncbi:hypothetical protein [Vitiosangium sp. GDMCC 1.1324]|uniref:hypothetical protein n=1 Tax=Vitiosangium sp. (strain GDMCC 1.1324) TaxID=2138576 RepID=UPI000D3CD9D2|nr:hypothetical protein [Vitiosangium sp. GDMCC 1.1324]PTL81068.1 hypothetical protein DAT35_23325 [Vitiosangium sp. GDMCC 1.1324]